MDRGHSSPAAEVFFRTGAQSQASSQGQGGGESWGLRSLLRKGTEHIILPF